MLDDKIMCLCIASIIVSMLLFLWLRSNNTSSDVIKTKKNKSIRNELKRKIDNMYERQQQQQLEQELEQEDPKLKITRNVKRSMIINQFRCPGYVLKNPQQLLELIEQNELSYPVRIRLAKDILRPLDTSIGDSVAMAMKPEHITDLCEKLKIKYNIQNNQTYVVVQELPSDDDDNILQEYVLSCTNGIIDKLYMIHIIHSESALTQPIIEDISLNNLSLQNKKYLRKILYQQHKKIGTINGTFDIGFFCDNLQTLFDISPSDKNKNKLLIVGISINSVPITQKTSNISNITITSITSMAPENIDMRTENTISYPYIPDISDISDVTENK